MFNSQNWGCEFESHHRHPHKIVLSFIHLSDLLLLSHHEQDHWYNISFEMNSTHSTDSTGGSMFVNHTDLRITRTKVRRGLNLSESGM